MALSRRHLFGRLAAAGAAGLAGWRGSTAIGATSNTPLPQSGIPKVVYHLSELEKATFVLGNIQNHYDGMGGPGAVHIALVVHGPALRFFEAGKTDPSIGKRVALMVEQGVELGACGNTLDAQELALSDLLPGFSRLEEGGVVRLARLQADGYAYLRP